ncbi:50S ribosomal protein L31 type B [Frankliniella fusca]|uniref:50S ribosomal protein L31 type B n=1 Tax=Frankliniella fusca TaxID=407009 RepID=A0AAE1LCJ9_9NEOP|nr:50S ribosomal protein L31 type B [Frankliniella fusca]
MCSLNPEFLFTFSIIKSIISSSSFKFFLSFQRFSRSFTNSYRFSRFQGFSELWQRARRPVVRSDSERHTVSVSFANVAVALYSRKKRSS